ncbi:DNA primase subunit PRI2 [Sporobolomyces koalae]|uniref:DNA primase subunit PRI2 n=1 Tax=Sporobolomyces koalae TaxID=500713 RepID=UPI003171E3D0
MYAGTRTSKSSASSGTTTGGIAAGRAYGGLSGAGGGAGEVTTYPRSGRYPHRLNFYQDPPVEEITLEQFEVWAIDRLRLLADIESAQARNRTFAEIKTIVENRSKEFMELHSDLTGRSYDLDQERRKDHYSHFVLRLAFCRSEELRQRYLKAEKELFRIRFESDEPEERRRFIDSLNFGWEKVEDSEKDALKDILAAASGIRPERMREESFFKVDWTKVTDLVGQRKVFLKAGKAYVPSSQEFSLVAAEFAARLSRGLELTAKALPRLDEDTRLVPVLSHLSMGFMAGITSDYTYTATGDGEAITAEMIPELSRQSFPLCMRNIQETLRTSKHLKHEGRQQYNLFLKGIGLSVEEAVVFWRKSFSTITDDKFNKEYRYNIRHGYGLEGSRKNYTPKSCTQIITGPVPGAGQCHGCPFRHQEANLTPLLQQSIPNLTNADLNEIVKSAKAGHYHVSCTRVFELQHAKLGVQKGDGLGGGDSVDHPNRYFDKSRQLVKDARQVEEAKNEEDETIEGGGRIKKESSRSGGIVKKEDAMQVDG